MRDMKYQDCSTTIEALRGDAIPDGWDPTSGGAYCRELWVASAAEALEINAALAGAAARAMEGGPYPDA